MSDTYRSTIEHKAATGRSSSLFARVLIVLLFSAAAPSLATNAQEAGGVTLTFDLMSEEPTLTGIAEGLEGSRLSGKEREQVAAIGSQIAKLQLEQSELLGLQAIEGLGQKVRVQPDFYLEPNEIRISRDAVALVRRQNQKYPNLSPDEAAGIILASVAQRSSSWDGGTYIFKSSAFRTVNPVVLGVSATTVQGIMSLCAGRPTLCEGSKPDLLPGNPHYRVYPQLLAMILEAAPPLSPGRQDCARARAEFNTQIERLLNQATHITELIGSDRQRDAIRAFDQSCLSPASTLPPEILDRLAVLRLPGVERPFCTAFQTGPDTFLTARHCFHDRVSGYPLRRFMETAQLFHFRRPGTPIEFVNPTAAEIGTTNMQTGHKREIPAQEDFLILKAEVRDDSVSKIELGEPVLGSRLIVPGIFLFADTRDRANDKAGWAQDIRTSREPEGGECRLLDASLATDGKQCLVHYCQALPGFSGSPVMQYSDDGSLALIGVHVRAAGNEDHHCRGPFAIGANKPSVAFGNFASRPAPGD